MTTDEINKIIKRLLDKGNSDFTKLELNLEKELLKSYKASLKEILTKIAAIYQKYGDDVTYADLVSFNRLKNLEASIVAEIKNITKDSIKKIQAGLKEFYSESFYRSAYALETGLGINLGYGLLNPDLIRASLLNPLDRIKWSDRLKEHSQQYIKQIRSGLTRGLIQGEGYAKIANSIEEQTKINASKVLRIVRTEGHRVQNTARVASFSKGEAAAKRLGIESTRIWIHSGNPREPREDHIEMNGVEAEKISKANGEEIFLFTLPDGVTTEGPGLTGKPEHDIHCGCTAGLKFKNLEAVSLEEYISKNYNSVEDWKADRINK